MLKKINIIKFLFWLVFGSIIFLNSIFAPNLQANEILFFLYQDPFGNVEMQQGQPAANPEFKYTDKEYEEDLDAFYFQARYYDPVAGRFWGRDRVTLENNIVNYFSMNSFLFTNNNPVNSIDREGLLTRKSIGRNSFRYDFDGSDQLFVRNYKNERHISKETGKLILSGPHFVNSTGIVAGAIKAPGNKIQDTIESLVNQGKGYVQDRSGFVSNIKANESMVLGTYDDLNSMFGEYKNVLVGGFQVVDKGVPVANIQSIPGYSPGSRLDKNSYRWSINQNSNNEAFILLTFGSAKDMANLAVKQGAVTSITFDAGTTFYLKDSWGLSIGNGYGGKSVDKPAAGITIK